jgi:fatty acid desaturase
MRDVPADVRLALVKLRRTDNWHNVLYLGIDWIVILAAIALTRTYPSLPGYLAAIVVIGSRQRALMNLVHEASHRKLFRSRPMNDWVGRTLVAFPLLTSLEGYVCAHCRHHGFLWDRERDPKARRYVQLGLAAVPTSVRSFVGRHVLRPLLLMHVPFNLRATMSFAGERRGERAARCVYGLIVVAVAIGTHTVALLVLFWLVPYLTSFQLIRYLAEMAEHAGLDSVDPWLASRNWTASAAVRHLLSPHSDDCYHLAHHLFPAIPHYRLKAADALLMRVPQYAAGHHCHGFFFSLRSGRPTVVHDILNRPETSNADPRADSGPKRHGTPGSPHSLEDFGVRSSRVH